MSEDKERKKCRASTRYNGPCKQWAVLDGLCLVHYQVENKLEDDREPGDNYTSKKARGEDVR